MYFSMSTCFFIAQVKGQVDMEAQIWKGISLEVGIFTSGGNS